MAGSKLDPADPASALALAIQEANRLEQDDRTYWRAVDRLRKEGAEEAWRLVTPLVHDERPALRSLVPDTLRYFEPHPKREATVELLAQMLQTETSPSVLASIATAFVDLAHEQAAELLPALATHDDPSVRRAAIHGLLSVAGPSTVSSFLRASSDPDTAVRNWATFGLRMILGEASDGSALDTAEIRSALVARLTDSEAEVRAEALLALATRRDGRALEALKRELSCWPAWDHCLEAAERFATPELLPFLEALLQQHPEKEPALRPALDACSPRG